MLEVDSVQLSFKKRKILSDIFISAEKGKISGLLGRNGQGKSSLFKIIYGTQRAEKFVRINGIKLDYAYRRPELIRYLPQFNFIPGWIKLKTVFKEFSIEFTDFSIYFPEYANAYLSRIDSLSGGGRRLVEIYSLIKSKSEFVLLDEPFSHLAPVQIDIIKDLLVQETRTKGFIITDHLYKNITEISSSLYVLSNQKTYLTSSMKDLQTL
ncbi:MAG TPA: ABC transporter ATP-binding protein, partial [Puia sp.]|nr:ABC transporter ATP-binding protein [Puia sp.]